MKKQTLSFNLTLTAFISSLLLICNSCKKIDTTSTPIADLKSVEKFFSLPKGISDEVLRITEKMKLLNSRTGYVETLIKKEGYAIWNKTIINVSEQKISAKGGTINNNDTIIYIPLVLENSHDVNSFIYAKLNGTITLKLFRGREYEKYGFDLSKSNNAKNFATQMILLNERVFDYKEFTISDKKLFNETNTLFQKLKNTRVFLKEPSKKSSKTTTTASRYSTTLMWVTHYGCGGSNPPCTSSSCDLCSQCSHTTLEYVSIFIDDYVSQSGNGNSNSSGGGGGGNSTITWNPNGPVQCNPTPLIENGLLPCEAGNNTGLTWLIPAYDDASPPFLWSNGTDNGETYTDPTPLAQPYFQFEPTDNYETLYPKFTDLVKKLKTFVKNNPKVLSALQKYSGFTKQQIMDNLTFGQGPLIKVEEMYGKFGLYNKEMGLKTLHIRASYVRGLETSFFQATQEATAFLLGVTILHEFVHLGTTVNHKSEGIYEFGLGFEKAAFNVIVDDNNAGSVVIKFNQYF